MLKKTGKVMFWRQLQSYTNLPFMLLFCICFFNVATVGIKLTVINTVNCNT